MNFFILLTESIVYQKSWSYSSACLTRQPLWRMTSPGMIHPESYQNFRSKHTGFSNPMPRFRPTHHFLQRYESDSFKDMNQIQRNLFHWQHKGYEEKINLIKTNKKITMSRTGNDVAYVLVSSSFPSKLLSTFSCPALDRLQTPLDYLALFYTAPMESSRKVLKHENVALFTAIISEHTHDALP